MIEKITARAVKVSTSQRSISDKRDDDNIKDFYQGEMELMGENGAVLAKVGNWHAILVRLKDNKDRASIRTTFQLTARAWHGSFDLRFDFYHGDTVVHNVSFPSIDCNCGQDSPISLEQPLDAGYFDLTDGMQGLSPAGPIWHFCQ